MDLCRSKRSQISLISLSSLIALLVFGALCGRGWGQSKNDADPVRQLESVFDTTSIAFGFLNLETLNLELVEKKVAELSGASDIPIKRVFEPVQQQLLASGAKHIYAIFSIADFAPEPVIALPLSDQKNLEGINQVVKMLEPWGYQSKFDPEHKLLVLGTETSLNRIGKNRFPKRENLGQILKGHESDVLSLNFIPDDEQLKVIREFTPQFSDRYKMIDGRLIAEGIESAKLSLKSLEPLRVNLNIQSANPKSAARLKEVLIALQKNYGLDRPEMVFLRQILNSLEVVEEPAGLELALGSEEERFWRALRPLFQQAQMRARDNQLVNQLKMIMLAMHNFHDSRRSFPDRGLPEDKGNPGLSWRVHLLPFLNQVELYKQFRLDESWDSEHNRKLIGKMPAAYVTRGMDPKSGKTVFVLPRGKGLFASPYEKASEDQKLAGRTFRDILDGTSNTIAVIPVSDQKAVIWTKPEDWQPVAGSVISDLKSTRTDRLVFATADGAVHQMNWSKLTEKQLLAMMTIAGGELVSFR